MDHRIHLCRRAHAGEGRAPPLGLEAGRVGDRGQTGAARDGRTDRIVGQGVDYALLEGLLGCERIAGQNQASGHRWPQCLAHGLDGRGGEGDAGGDLVESQLAGPGRGYAPVAGF